MRTISLSLSIFLSIAIATAATAASSGDEMQARAEAICAAIATRTDMPKATDADRAEFAAKDYCPDPSGEFPEPEAARRCCIAKGNCNRDLGLIYANGWGTARDYDAATYFLCRADQGEIAPFEMWSMVDRVREMREEDDPKALDYCDHITSGHGQYECAIVSGSATAAAENARTEALEKDFDAPTLAAAKALQAAANDFSSEEAGFLAQENRGGTAYNAIAVGYQTEAFSAHVERYLAAGAARVESADDARARAADAALNRVYRAALAASEPCTLCNDDDDSERGALREAQRAWIKYRDAFAAFYRTRWHGAAPDAALTREVVAMLTRARTAELQKRVDERA